MQATNGDTGLSGAGKASSEGSYFIPLLLLGHYSIAVEASGFKTFTRAGAGSGRQNIRVDEAGWKVDQTINVASSGQH